MPSGLHIAQDPLTALEKGKEAEGEGDLKEASKYYEAVIKNDKVDEFAFNRLMIIYRKLRKYKDELRVINAGIKRFEGFYRQTSKKGKGKKLTDLSNAFMKTSGLRDRKGEDLYKPEPLASWLKRKILVEKKLKQIK